MDKKTKVLRNQLVVIMDTSHPQGHNIQIGKTEPTVPTNQEELKNIVILDIATLCEALVVTIKNAHEMGIKDQEASLKDCLAHIKAGVADKSLQSLPRILELMK